MLDADCRHQVGGGRHSSLNVKGLHWNMWADHKYLTKTFPLLPDPNQSSPSGSLTKDETLEGC